MVGDPFPEGGILQEGVDMWVCGALAQSERGWEAPVQGHGILALL